MERLVTTENGSETSADLPLESFLAYRIGYFLWEYVSLVIIIMGTFGNIMTIIIMRKMKSERGPTIYVFFTALAFTDLVTIYMTLFPQWLYYNFNKFFIYDINNFMCKVLSFLNTSTGTMSNWILVFLTAHRTISVMWPHRVNVICTRRKILVLIFAIITVITALYSHYMYGFNVMAYDNSSKPTCHITIPEYVEFSANIFTVIDLLFYALLPSVCLVACNGVLVWKLARSVKEARNQLTSGKDQQVQTRTKTANSVTLTVIVMSLTFIILFMPTSVLHIQYFTVVYKFETVTNEEYAKVYLISDLTILLAYSNSAVNFYLYCLTGRKFRQLFLNTVSCGILCKGDTVT